MSRMGRLLTTILMLTAAPAAALDCRLALVLAIDVSSSVDPREDTLQRQGLAAALLAPEVQQAFFVAPQPVALSAFEWSGRTNQKILLDWTLIDSPSKLLGAAESIAYSQRSTDEFPTALGHAVSYGWKMLDRGPRCLFSTIDVAGDGENNEGFGPQHAYRAFGFGDIVVNGLAILSKRDHEDDKVVAHYQSDVLRGPGAFLEIAEGFEDYESAMRRKLERELRPLMMGEVSE